MYKRQLEDCGAIPVDKLKGKRIGQLYTLLVVVLGFTLFRADTLAQAGAMYAAMFSGVGLHWLGTAAVWAKLDVYKRQVKSTPGGE